jgi:hypothetical protein
VAAVGATTVEYSAGRDFTSYAGSTYTVKVGAETSTVRKPGIRDVVDPAQPDQSLALVKTRKQPAGGPQIHGGGGFWTVDDADYRAIHQWIAEGALDN